MSAQPKKREEAEQSRRDPLQLRALVLNADGRPLPTWPLTIISAQEAVAAVIRDRAVTIDTWEDAFFRSPSTRFPVPKVIMLREYTPVDATPKFCRRSILLRDHYRCQYCGEQFASNELTFDHVVPRSKNGRTEWTNIASACIPCNTLKADKPSMRPIRPPVRPTSMQLLRAGLEFLPNDIREDFGSFLYWNTELRA